MAHGLSASFNHPIVRHTPRSFENSDKLPIVIEPVGDHLVSLLTKATRSMRIGILSDTHDQLDRTRTAIELLRRQGVEALFHCGDLIGPKIVEACAVLPCYFTFGNNDDDSIPELKQAAIESKAVCVGWGDVVELAGKRIGLVHGHLTTELRRVQAGHPDYVLSGHSHIPDDTRVGTLRRINPGALHRARRYTVAVLDLKSDQLEFVAVPR